ncbi:MAG: hypothetical protein EHM21_16395, partial [Chloroflexi bacterium]
MKTCPYCGADNHADAPVCYACGNSLGTVPYAPLPNSAEPTQPVRARNYRSPANPPGPYDTQQIAFPPGSYPAQDPYAAQQNPPPTQTQSWTTYPPAYTPPPAYIPPPPPPPGYNQGPSKFWPVLTIGLAAVLLFACGFAVWTLTYATNAEANRLRVQVATQMANTFGGA